MAECNGDANIMANAECKAACETRADAHATCDPPVVTIVAVAPVNAADQAKVTALIATLTTNYPKILKAQARLQYGLAPAAVSFVTSIRSASTSLASVGIQAGACMASAVEATVDAAAEVDASVSVSVMVSASVTASGSS
jgi:hypothetical protein